MYQLFLLYLALPSTMAMCATPGTHPDLPNPPSIVKTLPVGTWIVPMDDKQLDGNGDFNLAAYGYVVRCLWADIKVNWIIKACKKQGQNDFKAVVRQILPYWNPKPEFAQTAFKYGAFAILSPHFALLPYQNLVQNISKLGESAGSLVPPNVYILETSATVEVRHSWVMKPRIAVLGIKNAAIHTNILKAAGLIEHYHFESMGVDAQELLSTESCYTFVSNPHDDLSEKPQRAANVSTFTHAGGNFLAQCHGVRTYGMYAARYGKQFLLTTADAGTIPNGGISGCSVTLSKMTEQYCPAISDVSGTIGSATSGESGPGTIEHTDLPYLQFDQSLGFKWNQGGSWQNGHVASIQNNYDHSKAYIDLSNGFLFRAMSGQINNYRKGTTGGMVYYLAGHKYDSSCDSDSQPNGCAMNGRRMYMNAAITPAVDRASACGLTVITRKICDYGICEEITEKPVVGSPTPADAINIKDCAWDGLPPRTCIWSNLCDTIPACMSSIIGEPSANNPWSCFPNYCGDCQMIWQNQITGEMKFCPGDSLVNSRGTSSPSFAPVQAFPTTKPTNFPTNLPPSKFPTMAPLPAGVTRAPTTSSPTKIILTKAPLTGGQTYAPTLVVVNPSDGVKLVGNFFMVLVSITVLIALM